MPLYCYRCQDCSHEFEVRHSMSFEDQKCEECNSINVFKVPSLGQVKKVLKTPGKAGKIVNQYIEDMKKEVKQEKRSLRSREI